MAKRPQTEKQRLALEHGRAVRAANLEARKKAQASRERTLDLTDGGQSGGRSEPVTPPAKPPARKRTKTAQPPERTEEAPRTGGGFLGGLVDAFRS